jgi:predicted secreted Zn-dependent protease
MNHATSSEPGQPPSTTTWFKSSYSASNASCVEVRFDTHTVSIRDTKDNGNGPTITVTPTQWTTFLATLNDQPTTQTSRALTTRNTPDQGTILRATATGTTLQFTKTEWDMFLAGVHTHEFNHPTPHATAHP